MTDRPYTNELPVLLTPEQLATGVFQIGHDESHIAHLRRHSGLPYVQFQINGERIFRYPRDAVIQWIASRTHGVRTPERPVAPPQQAGARRSWSSRR